MMRPFSILRLLLFDLPLVIVGVVVLLLIYGFGAIEQLFRYDSRKG